MVARITHVFPDFLPLEGDDKVRDPPKSKENVADVVSLLEHMAEPFFLPVVNAHESVGALVHDMDAVLIKDPQIHKGIGIALELRERRVKLLRVREVFIAVGVEDEFQVSPSLPQEGIDHLAVIFHDAVHAWPGCWSPEKS